MRAEHFGRIGFGRLDRPAVVKQRSHCRAFDAGISAEQVFPKEIEEFTADGAFGKGDAALVARRGLGVLRGRQRIVE